MAARVPQVEPDVGFKEFIFRDMSGGVNLEWRPRADHLFYGRVDRGFKSGGFSNSAILSNLSPPLVNGAPCISPRLGGTCTASQGDDPARADGRPKPDGPI